ncbi:hypothetical protein C6341_g18391 [Phytophthora cactorum]|nr:hypothetical protein C6341_g18391 [Phytophthora cactorum]
MRPTSIWGGPTTLPQSQIHPSVHVEAGFLERERAVDDDVAAVAADTLKSFDIDNSETIICTIRADTEHKMRYRLLVCNSQA